MADVQKEVLVKTTIDTSQAVKAEKDLAEGAGEAAEAIGGQSEALQGTEEAMSNLPGPLGQVVTGFKGLVTAAKAFLLTPIGAAIGALVAAFSALGSFLTRTQEGVEILNKVTAGFQATLDVLIDRVSAVGKGLFTIFVEGDLFEGLGEIKDAFVGIGDEIEREIDLAVSLAGAMDDLIKRENDQ